VCGGYRLARPFRPEGDWRSPRVPAEVVTVCSCLAVVGPGPWALPWVTATDLGRLDEATALGVPADRLAEAMRWTDGQLAAGGWGWPEVFATPEVARAFVERFVPEPGDLRLLGVALPVDAVPAYLADHPLPTDPSTGVPAVDAAVRSGLPPAPGGTVLGHEVLGEEIGGTFHSWYCHGLEPMVHTRLGVEVNGFGLLDDRAEAEAVAALVGSPDVGAEPVPWRAWAVIAYPVV